MSEIARDEQTEKLKRYLTLFKLKIKRPGLILLSLSLLTSGDYSDFVITCGSDKYHVHKAIVCSQSDFFKKAERFPGGKVSCL